MNTRTVKIILFFLAAFIILTVASQTYFMLREEYTTVTALPYSASYQTTFTGIYVRDEEIISGSVNGVVSYVADDGGKVGVGTIIAEVYPNDDFAVVGNEISGLEHELAILEKIQNQGTLEAAQPSNVAQHIGDSYRDVSRCIETGDLEQLTFAREELFTNLCTMRIITGDIQNFQPRINEINSRLATLRAAKQTPTSVITSDKSGFFVSRTDGFESVLSTESLDTITVTEIQDMISAGETPELNAFGKVIHGLDWYLVAVIDNSKKVFEVGSKVNLRLLTSEAEVSARIADIRYTDDFCTSILILSCNEINADYVQNRFESVEMTNRTVYKGIKVPRETIRFSNGVKGVYVKLGDRVSFKKINIIFEDEDYVISDISPSSDYLALYDDIVLEGVGTDNG